jgi:hypothetical protein
MSCLGRVSSLNRQVGEGLVPSPLASNLTLFRRTPYGVTTNGAKMRKTNPISSVAGVRRKESCKTKPNLGGLGYVGKRGCPVGRGSARE